MGIPRSQQRHACASPVLHSAPTSPHLRTHHTNRSTKRQVIQRCFSTGNNRASFSMPQVLARRGEETPMPQALMTWTVSSCLPGIPQGEPFCPNQEPKGGTFRRLPGSCLVLSAFTGFSFICKLLDCRLLCLVVKKNQKNGCGKNESAYYSPLCSARNAGFSGDPPNGKCSF